MVSYYIKIILIIIVIVGFVRGRMDPSFHTGSSWSEEKKAIYDNINNTIYKENKEPFYNMFKIACEYAVKNGDNEMACGLVQYNYMMSMYGDGWYVSRIDPNIMRKLKEMKDLYFLEIDGPESKYV